MVREAVKNGQVPLCRFMRTAGGVRYPRYNQPPGFPRGAGGAGAESLRAIAAGLNARGIPTARRNGQWSAVQVSRVIERGEPLTQRSRT
jgi:hypothetical protein